MLELILPCLSILIGLFILAWSADHFVDGASLTAKHLGMSPMLIGLTIVAMGTSAPEIIVSAVAAFEGSPQLAIGNVLGSNIANIAFVLGLTTLYLPIPMGGRLAKFEMPILLLVSATLGILMLDLYLGIIDSIVLLVMLVTVLFILYFKSSDKKVIKMDPIDTSADKTLGYGLLWLLIGSVLLLVGSRILIWGAKEVALFFNISDLIIGLTILAVGTSLPELAACIASVRKKQADLALGNIIGSNIFNILIVMAIPGLIDPVSINENALDRDYSLMLLLTVGLYLFGLRARRTGQLSRPMGAFLLLIYCAYMAQLYIAAQS